MIDEKKDEVIEEVKDEVIEEATDEVKAEATDEVTEEAPTKREIISREGVMILLGYETGDELTERDEALINETLWRFNRVII